MKTSDDRDTQQLTSEGTNTENAIPKNSCKEKPTAEPVVEGSGLDSPVNMVTESLTSNENLTAECCTTEALTPENNDPEKWTPDIISEVTEDGGKMDNLKGGYRDKPCRDTDKLTQDGTHTEQLQEDDSDTDRLAPEVGETEKLMLEVTEIENLGSEDTDIDKPMLAVENDSDTKTTAPGCTERVKLKQEGDNKNLSADGANYFSMKQTPDCSHTEKLMEENDTQELTAEDADAEKDNYLMTQTPDGSDTKKYVEELPPDVTDVMKLMEESDAKKLTTDGSDVTSCNSCLTKPTPEVSGKTNVTLVGSGIENLKENSATPEGSDMTTKAAPEGAETETQTPDGSKTENQRGFLEQITPEASDAEEDTSRDSTATKMEMV